eukprot:72826-Chlamydomonas_euryale.AAC.1
MWPVASEPGSPDCPMLRRSAARRPPSRCHTAAQVRMRAGAGGGVRHSRQCGLVHCSPSMPSNSSTAAPHVLGVAAPSSSSTHAACLVSEPQKCENTCGGRPWYTRRSSSTTAAAPRSAGSAPSLAASPPSSPPPPAPSPSARNSARSDGEADRIAGRHDGLAPAGSLAQLGAAWLS